MGFCPLVASLKTWNYLTAEQKAAVEEAAAISDAYFEAVERDLEHRVVAALRNAGVIIRRMTKRTTWLGYRWRKKQYGSNTPKSIHVLKSSSSPRCALSC
jgi:TRAP-type C4-dicarboxylate transport system substrate-binding protein